MASGGQRGRLVGTWSCRVYRPQGGVEFYCDFKGWLLLLLKSLQSCPILCNSRDGSPPGFPVPGILQARIMVWVAISFFNAWKWKVKVKSLSVWLLATPWTAAHQAPPSMGFSRQEYWSGVPLPSPSRGGYWRFSSRERAWTDLYVCVYVCVFII